MFTRLLLVVALFLSAPALGAPPRNLDFEDEALTGWFVHVPGA